MLINCTNHPYDIWNEPQRKGAAIYGEVLDMPFPVIEPDYTKGVSSSALKSKIK